MEKTREWAITPSREEGAYIRFLLMSRGVSCAAISRHLGISRAAVTRTLFGRCHAARVESCIAQVCGYPSWNAMMNAIRQEVRYA